MSFLKNRRFQLESLEERTLLTAAPWSTAADDAAVATLVVVTDSIPVEVQTTDPTAAAISEVDLGDTFYVSVYVQGTDGEHGVTTGYCALYYEEGVTWNEDYTASSLFPQDVRTEYSVSEGEELYISAYGGNPNGMLDEWGIGQWALVGTVSFTADVDGDYTFWTDTARGKNGAYKAAWNFLRSDVLATGNDTVSYDSVNLTVKGLPTIDDVTVADYSATYDGAAHAISVEGLQAGDTVAYSADGETYDLAEAPTYVFGEGTTYVKVSRAGYQDFYAAAQVNITAAQLSATISVADKDYDGNDVASVTIDSISGLVEGDEVMVWAVGNFETALPGLQTVSVEFEMSGADAAYYIAPAATATSATINALTIDDVVVEDVEVAFDRYEHSIVVEGIRPDDVVTYTYDGVAYDVLPTFVGDGSVDTQYVITVDVDRVGYNHFTADGTLTITAADAPEIKSLVVTTLEDVVNPYDFVTSLREAMAYAETFEYDVTVSFDEALEGTIALNGALALNAEAGVTIDGDERIVLDAQGNSRIFRFGAGETKLMNIELVNGSVAGDGGAILSDAYLTLDNVTIKNSYAGHYGGAIYVNDGSSLYAVDVQFAFNTAKNYGGAIFVSNDAFADINDAVLNDNSANYGGAFYAWNGAYVFLSDTVVVNNSSKFGTIRVFNATANLGSVLVANNQSGIFALGSELNAVNVTVANNAGRGLKLDNNAEDVGATANFKNSIIINNGLAISVSAESALDGDTNLGTEEFGTNYIVYDATRPLFGDDGYTLVGDNQALNAGVNDYVTLNVDALGNKRIYAGTVDLGACEQIITATANTWVFDGQEHDAATIDGPYDFVMYGDSPETCYQETLTFRDAGSYTFWVWAGTETGEEDEDVYYELTCVVTPLQLTVDGSYVLDHGYDGTTNADVVVGDVATLYDDVTVTATGQFASAEIGVQDVAVQYQVNGAKAGNYIAPADETLSGEIKAKEEASMVVTTLEDVVCDTDYVISLREAMTVYYGTGGCTTVTFAEGLEGVADLNATLDVSGMNGLVVNGDGRIAFDGEDFVIFQMNTGANVAFNGLTFQNLSNSGFGTAFACGWGCQDGSFENVVFTDCNFFNTTCQASGGAIMATGVNLTIDGCNFDGNATAGNCDGAVWMCWGYINVNNSYFTNNFSGRNGVITNTASNDYSTTVTNSTFENNSNQAGNGAGVYADSKSITVTDCSFTGNTAAGSGGAIATPGGAHANKLVTIDGCSFTNNTAGSGGAVSVTNNNGNELNLSNSEFIGNTANGSGGAVQVIGCDYHISDCSFSANTANGSFSDGGAVYTAYGANCTIDRSTFDGNVATGLYAGKGGALHITSQSSPVTISDCTFTGNEAYGPNYYWGWGGAICREGGNGVISLYNCSIVGNKAYMSGHADGNLSVQGGGLYVTGSGVLNMVQCLVAENSAVCEAAPSYGGGIYTESPAAIWYCTITNNSTSGSANSVGGGIFNSSAMTILGSLVTGNSVPSDNLWDGAGADIWQGGALTINYSAVDAAAIAGGEFNADDNCYFIQAGDSVFAEGSYELAADSVAIDGTMVATAPFSAQLKGFDLNGAPDNYRLCGDFVDYGCYEYQLRDEPSLVVTTESDIVNDHDLVNSLREALAYAAELGGVQTITFAEGIANVNIDSWMEINSAVTIEAAGITFGQSDDGIHGAFKVMAGDAEGDFVVINDGDFVGFTDGAIANYGALQLNTTDFINNTTDFATSSHKANGAAIYNEGTLVADNILVAGNAGYRDGDACWGAVCNSTGAIAVIANSVIVDNYAGCGAGFTNIGGTAVLRNCTVAGNWSSYDDGATYGEAIFGFETVIEGYGVTLVYNTLAANNFGGNSNVDMGNASLATDDAGFMVAPSFDGAWDADAWMNWDLRLTPASECIEAGNNAWARTASGEPYYIAYDFGGEDRICGANVDIGAYEFTVALESYEGVFDGEYHFAITDVIAPTLPFGAQFDMLYSADGVNYTDDTSVITFRNAGTYDAYVCVFTDYAEIYFDLTVEITPLQLTVEGSWVEPNLPGNTDAWIHVGDVQVLYDDVTITATGTFESGEVGKDIPVDVQYQVNGEMAGNYYAPVDEVLFADINEAEEASMHVTTDRDIVNAADGLISLREALTVYYGVNGCTTVTFDDALTTITVENEGFELAGKNGLVVDGAGHIVFDGEDFVIFTMTSGTNVEFDGLTFQNLSNSGFGTAFACGWGCQDGSFENVVFNNCNFFNTTCQASGGAIMATGVNLKIDGCSFDNNITAGNCDGAVWMCWGYVDVNNSSFTNNFSGRNGVITNTASNDYATKVTNSTFENNRNQAGNGAGVYADSKSITVTGSTFTGNYAAGNGGAIATPGGAHANKQVTIDGCSFTNNTASSGGAVSVTNNNGNALTLTNSEFVGNTANGSGGAVQVIGCDYHISDCSFSANTANGSFSDGGAVYTAYGVNCTIDNSTFEGNVATGLYAGKGGALHITSQSSPVTITNCDFYNNEAYGPNYYWGWGGAICREGGSGTISLYNCEVVGNKAYMSGHADGNLSVQGGGLYVTGGGVLNMVQCLVAENSTVCEVAPSYGGGIYTESPAAIWFCTITNNSASGNANAVGGGIFNSSAMTILGSLVAENSVPSDNLWAGAGADIWQGGALQFNYSVYDAAAITGGEYNADDLCYAIQEGDAVFAEGSYQLAPHSVAIDSTQQSKVFSYSEDLAGNPRVQGFSVDAGCYEYQGGKVYVCVVLSDSVANMEESAELPQSITEAEIGSTVYAQVWVKNMDGSAHGITGGYTDLTFSDVVLDVQGVSASSIYADNAEYFSTAIDGLISTFGGTEADYDGSYGVDSWALLGNIEFTVSSFGTATVNAGQPTYNGAASEALDMSRVYDGALADANIEYWGASLTVVAPRIAGPELLSVSSYGANRQRAEWTVVKGAAVSAYELAYTTNGTDWTYVQTTNLYSVVTGLTYGANVTYKVRALSASADYRDSEWSNEITLNVCPMDIDGDGFIGTGDYAILSAAYFTTPSSNNWDARADIDGDGFVGPADVSWLAANWFKAVDDADIAYPAAKAADAAFESLDVDDLAVDFDF